MRTNSSWRSEISRSASGASRFHSPVSLFFQTFLTGLLCPVPSGAAGRPRRDGAESRIPQDLAFCLTSHRGRTIFPPVCRKSNFLSLPFRRKNSPFVSADFRLHALDPDATYELTDADTRRKRQVSGCELTEKGLNVAMKTAPASRLVFYRVAPNREGE